MVEGTLNLLLIDTDVFVKAEIFTGDKEHPTSKQFLEEVKTREKITTSIFNLFELCSIASHHRSTDGIEQLFRDFHFATWIQILYPKFNDEPAEVWFKRFFIENTFAKIKKKLNPGDAVVIILAEEHNISKIVTWNKDHFKRGTALCLS